MARGRLLRSSKSRHDRVGAALAGLLGLTGIVLLIQARPIPTPSFHRSYVADDVETRAATRDTPATGWEEASIRAPERAARASAWIRPLTPASPLSSPSFSPPLPEPVAVPVDAAEAAPAQASAPPRLLATILRASGLACLGGREALLSPAERELCREKLGARDAASMPAIPPDERADYDAVARAQAPRRAMVPLTARGAGGGFGPDDRLRAGRRPRVGCSLRFGPNADQASDASGGGLRAGPCALQPTASPAPAEADMRRPY